MRRTAILAAIMLPVMAIACTATRKHENDQAAANLRAAMPSIAAYWQDHDTYSGMTLARLRYYDPSIPNLSIVRLGRKTYCIETDSGNPRVFFDTETFELRLGSCSDPTSGKPYDSQPSSTSNESVETASSLRASVPAIEAYWQDHNSYAGMTLKKLRQIDYGLPGITIVSATKKAYCVEISANGESSYMRGGPSVEIAKGTCPK